MARFSQSIDSFTGTASSTTVQSVALTANTAPGCFVSGTMAGYIGALIPNATTGAIKVRRVTLGVRVSSGIPPVSQQMTIALYRQTTRPSGTGISTITGASNLDPASVASSIIGFDYANVVNAPSAATTGATATGANPIYRISFNTQNTIDIPFEFLEEMVISAGQGLAFVNIGTSNPLPANHLFTIGCEWEE